MRVLLTAAVLAFAAVPALAAPVQLKAELVDDDGRITLGELFEGAGRASDVQVGARTGASALLDAGRLQQLARQAGLDWANEQGLRRLIVRSAETAGPPLASATAARSAPVIRKDEAVTVRFEREGVSLTLQGKALEPAARGQTFSVLNPASKKIVEAVAVGPGRAVVGPEADRLKAEQYASR